MTFSKTKSTHTGGHTLGTQYTDPITGTQHIMAVDTLHFFGVFLHRDLNWMPHIKIMANCTHSTICRISILGNSICSLNFLNWRNVMI